MWLTGLLLVCNTVVLIGLALVGWRYRSTPGVRSFAVLQIGSALWVGLTLLGLSVPPSGLRIRVWGVTVATSLFVTALWISFIFEYTGRERWLEPRRIGPLVTPLVAGAVLYAVAPTQSGLVDRATQVETFAGTVVRASIGPIGAVTGLYLYGIFLGGLLVVTVTVLRQDQVFTGQATALVLGTLVTVAASVARIAGVAPVEGYPVPQAALGLQSVLWGYAVFSRGLFARVPALSRIGEQTIFENIDDGLLVTDQDGTIVRTNPEANSVFEQSPLVGADVASLFADLGVDTTADRPQQFSSGGRSYRLQISEMRDWHDEVTGRAYIVTDISGLVRRRQRLEVLNRVLRHNVRNEVTVIRGSAEQIERCGDQTVSGLGERITDHADRLATLSDKARELQRVFDVDPAAKPVALPAVVGSVTESLTDQTEDAAITVDAEEVATSASGEVLTLVVRETVENALKHGGPEPAVEIDTFESGGTARVVIEDDGPGIPSSELRPVRSGEESALEHTTGLGLWLMHWGIQAVDGRIDIDSGPDGTTVTLSVPTVSGDEVAQSTRASHSDGSSISASVGR